MTTSMTFWWWLDSGKPPVAARGASGSLASLLPASMAALGGWLAVAIDNAVSICFLPLSAGGWGARIMHVLVALGHTLAIGLVVVGAVAAWGRWGSRRPLLGLVAAALASATLFAFVLSDDLEGAVERWTTSRGAPALAFALGAVLGLVPAAAMLVGWLGSRPLFRWLGLGAGALVILSNHFVLVNGYSGAHFWIAAIGATLFGASLHRVDLGTWLPARATPRRARFSLVLVTAFALASVVLPTPRQVLHELLERDLAFLAIPLSRLHAPSEQGHVVIPRELRPWFEPRTNRPDVEPSSQRLLPPGPIVIFITIDALRLEVLSERKRSVAPNLHDIKSRSVYFSQARSPGSDTRYSLAAIFAGRYFSMLKWTGLERSRPTLERDLLPRIPEVLTPSGIPSAVGHAVPQILDPSIAVLRGFGEEYVSVDEVEGEGTPVIIDKAIARLERQGPGPFFFYSHLVDPHVPYLTHGKKAKNRRAQYMAEVSFVDEHIGRLRKAVKDLGLEQRTMLIISADHGEGFGEHGIYFHNKSLYEVMVHVPLMIECPGVKPRTVDDYVSVMDVAPTIFDVFGVKTPGWWMAESLVPLLTGERAAAGRPVFMERRRERVLLFADGIKVLLREKPWTEEVYDLRRDPGEEKDLRESMGAEGDRRAGLARAYAKAHAWVDGAPASPPP